MAESILFNVVANILTKLGSPAVKELGLLWGVDDELQKLDDTLSAIQAVLADAEEQLRHSNTVENWVSKLKDVLYEIEDLMDECAYDALRTHVLAKDKTKRNQVRMLFTKFKRPYSNLKLAHKIKDIRKRLKAINEDKTQFSFSDCVLDTSVSDEFKKKRETYSFILQEEVIGRNNDQEEIIKLLMNTNIKEDIAIISIVGMGGLGKTTLTQSVYNNRMIAKHFELKLWVCVSEDFDVKIIVEKIIESATKKKPQCSLQMDSLQSELRKEIDGKKYLLVMDDVWNEDYEKWVCLKRLLVGGAKGSRILITTRGQKVANTLDTTFLHSLQNLDESNSWLLFKKMTFMDGEEEEIENSNLVKIGREIVAKLRGVPLAIRTIGRLLKEKKSQKFWQSFKDGELYQVMGQGENNHLDYMRSILELSYKHLPANLKQCFLYCTLFPKDHEIQKNELILQWRAQGFISSNNEDELMDIGEDYFLELLSKSFFQEVTKDAFGNIEACKMHDLMHDLACSITKNECMNGLRNDIDKRTCHLSMSLLSWEESKELQETLSKARNLRTFFMLKCYFDMWEIDMAKFFQDHLRLRTLEFGWSSQDQKTKFFKSINRRFKHLRYLSISGLDLKELPNCITELYNLETLILQSWGLKKLPSDIKNLINLKYFDLSFNISLDFLPDSITELCKLEALILHMCVKLKELPRDVKNLRRLRHLDLSSTSIKFLPDSFAQLNNLERLLLCGCSNLKELPEDIKKLINLKHLDICQSEDFTHMPKGLGELVNLQTLNEFVLGENNGARLSELNELSTLKGRLSIRNLQFCSVDDLQLKPKLLQLKSGLRELRLNWDNSSNELTVDVYERVLDCLQPHSNLQELEIYGYGGVKLCNWLSSSSLGHLVEIHLFNCERLEHLPQFDQFLYLKILYLVGLPNIEYIVNDDSVSSSTFFPSLEKLWIKGAPKLKRLWKGTTSMESNESNGGSFSITFPCLSQLKIDGCPLRILMSWHAPLLEELVISDSEDGHGFEEDEFDVIPWQNFENLSSLKLFCLSKFEYLPKCLQHVTTLLCLTLFDLENLKSLPEWIDNLTLLTELEISGCRKLTFLPERIRHIHGLKSLRIHRCPLLEERCKKVTGEEWPKIAHIPKLTLSWWLQ